MSAGKGDCHILIIGGGAAGLSTAGALAKRGIDSTVIEQDNHIGGTWERRYDSLKLHTVRRYSCLAHHRISKAMPHYLTKDEYAKYLREYAEILGLEVSLGEQVKMVQRASDCSKNMIWEVQTSAGIRRACVIVIATGHCAKAVIPPLGDIEKFRGTVLHSSRYTTGRVFKDLKSLVIGLGNSGAEIAADLATHGAASVSVSVRRTPPIVSREIMKIIPVQLFGIALSTLGIPKLIDGIGTFLRRISLGDLGQYGLRPADWGAFTARRPAVIDTGFVEKLKGGYITVRPEIARFDSSGVIYSDGEREDVDVVIAATGYRTGLEKIVAWPEVIGKTGQPRYHAGVPTSAPGLYFIGFDETIRGQLFEINRESKRLALEIEHYMNGLEKSESEGAGDCC